MRIEVLAPKALSQEHLQLWARLQKDEALSSPFLSSHWVRTLAACSGPDSAQAQVAVLHQDGEVVGFLPARVSRFTAMAPGAPLCDYQGLIAERRTRVDPREIVAAFGVARLDFDKLLVEQPSFRAHVRGVAPSYVIDLREGYDAYVQDRNLAGTDVLKDCSKKKRKLQSAHGPCAFLAEETGLPAFEQLIAWKRAQYLATGQTDIFEAGWPLEVLRSLLASKDPGCQAKLFTLKAGDRLIAAHLALCTQKIVHAWFIAHDDSFGCYSPGVMLLGEVIRWAGERGYCEVDLGAGDYRFKRSLANRTRLVTHGFVGRASAASLVRGAAYRVRELAEALPLGAASTLPGKAMRRLDMMRSLG